MGNMLLTSKELEALGEDPITSTYNIDRQMEKVLMTREQREAERKKEDAQKQAQKDAAAAEDADNSSGGIRYVTKDSDGNQLFFTYRNMNFFHSDGRRYDTTKEEVDDGNMYLVLKGYRKILSSGDTVLINILKTLETSNNLHYVYVKNQGQGSGVHKYKEGLLLSEEEKLVKQGKPIGSETTYDFSKKAKNDFETSEQVKASEFTTIVHEMQHQYDYDQGKMADAKTGTYHLDPAEIRAVNTENRARKLEVPKSKRITYGGEKIDPKKLE